ncbi:uncharacterized protein LOC141629647 [Silene latifolia]|uniref:uncharacterized protein LOC141629647 n=1 Tax=Silene latifolia TaxID=37657 RepID=UPI003D76C77D
MKISSWNIRGRNDPIKQQEVLEFLRLHQVDIMGVLDTRIKEKKAKKVIHNKFKACKVICNYNAHVNGRIWLVWKPTTVDIHPLIIHSQFIHCEVFHHATYTKFHLTMIYASNNARARDDLWHNLRTISTQVHKWILLGDFNVVRDVTERISNTPPNLADILDCNSCLLHCGVADITSTGCEMTWTNKQDIDTLVWSKLDRALTNVGSGNFSILLPLLSSFRRGIRSLPYSCYLSLRISISGSRFSFLNSLDKPPDYHDPVNEAWREPVQGSLIFTLFGKLKHVKKRLKALHKENFNQISQRVHTARDQLSDCQIAIHEDFSSTDLYEKERELMATYLALKAAESTILKQKAKLDHISYNDSSSKYFSARIHERQQNNLLAILKIKMEMRELSHPTSPIDVAFIQASPCVPEDDIAGLIKPIGADEIRAVVFSIGSDKSPVRWILFAFFKASRDIVGPDIRKAIQAYFKNGR